MKVIVLTLTTLCLIAATRAKYQYTLKCAREEVGIRWPSYYSNSEYYICQHEGGKQLTINCPEGEVFTFVLQSCTTPNRYIPPPSINVLPTSSSLSVSEPQNHVETLPSLPKPIHTSSNEGLMRPPVIGHDEVQQHNWASVPVPPHGQYSPESPVYPMTDDEIPHPPSVLDLPANEKPQVPVLPSKDVEHQDAPLPPTPAPTPPVVAVTPPSKKKPPALPSAGKKQPPKPAGKKQPPVPQGKKPSANATAKAKQPPKPTGKKPNSS